MAEQWTLRQLDKGNCLILDTDGTWVCLCDAQYVDLLMAAPVMSADNQRLRAALAALLDAGQLYAYTTEADALRLAAAEREARAVLGGAPGVGGNASVDSLEPM